MYILSLLYIILFYIISIYGIILYNGKNIIFECNDINTINLAICYDSNLKFCIINNKNETYILNPISNNKIMINPLISVLFNNNIVFCYNNNLLLLFNKYIYKFEEKPPTIFKKLNNITYSIPYNISSIDYYDTYFIINKSKYISKQILNSFLKHYKKNNKVVCKKKIPIYSYNDIIINENIYITIIILILLIIIFIAYIK